MTGRRFVPSSTIRDRMDRVDLRFEREARRRRPTILPSEVLPFVDVVIVRAPDAVGPVIDVGLEPAPTLTADCDHCLRATGEIVELIAGVCPVCRLGGVA